MIADVDEARAMTRDLELLLIVVHTIAHGPPSHARPYALAVLRRLQSRTAIEIRRVLDAPISGS